MVKELLKNDVIVLHDGLHGHGLRQGRPADPGGGQGILRPGLAEVCETVGIPPVLHMGSCVDNTRILMAATAVVKEGGLGDDITDLPAAGAAPEWMSEKAISIGQYFVASGVYTVFGVACRSPAPRCSRTICSTSWRAELGGKWDFEVDPVEHAHKMIAHIDKKRKELGIDKARERVLFDMEARRQLDEDVA